MVNGTNIVAHEDIDTGTSNIYKFGYGKRHCSTLPIRYPLPSLIREQTILKILALPADFPT